MLKYCQKINSRDLSRRAKTDLLSFQEKMRKEQNNACGDGSLEPSLKQEKECLEN